MFAQFGLIKTRRFVGYSMSRCTGRTSMEWNKGFASRHIRNILIHFPHSMYFVYVSEGNKISLFFSYLFI